MKKIKSKLILITILILFTFNISVVYSMQADPFNTGVPDFLINDHELDVMNSLYSSSPPDIASPSSILVETDRGQVLFEKNSKERLHISAATKIMTVLVAIEELKDSLSSKVTISRESVDTEGAALKLVVGEKYSIEDLLYAIILMSANDASIAIAEYIAGDMQKFVSLMNEKAKELELYDTIFANSTGLYDENQYTTAYDISILIRHAIRNPTFNRIFSSKSRPLTSGSGSVTIMVNQNSLFWEYEGIDGGKTGFNNEDQHTVITTATRNNRRLISIILDSPKEPVFEDSSKLLDYGFNNFRKGTLIRKDEVLENIMVADKTINLICTSDVYYTYPIGQDYITSYEVNVAKNLELPIKKSISLGSAKYILDDNTVININLYPDTDISQPDDFKTKIKKKLEENKDILYLVLILIAIEILIILYKIIVLISKLFTKRKTSSKKD